MTGLRIVIAGGGTGGHLYPGIAVAREVLRREPGATITFAGTARGIESRVIPKEGFQLDLLRSAGLKGTSPAALARGLALLPLSGVDAWQILSRRSPHLVMGVGGYSSGPVLAAAIARRIPTASVRPPSHSPQPSGTSEGGGLSQAILFVPSSSRLLTSNQRQGRRGY